MMRRSLGVWLWLAACGGPGAGSDGSSSGATGGASTGDTPTTGDSGGVDGEACSVEALRQPAVAVTYYVAIGDPGASNEDCDGLAASDEGDGHCPFKDLSSAAVLGRLDGAKGTRLALRAGTYVVSGWEGLRVAGMGSSEAESVVLSAYEGEAVVLDVAAPDGASCMQDDAPTRPECVRQVVRVSGQHTVVQGLTIRNGLGYNLEVTGGAHHRVRCNEFTETVEFAPRSDSLKLDANAEDVVIADNEFSRWRSQAIDITGVRDVVVERNEFHDPHDADGGAVGIKFGARDVTIRDNDVHDLGSSNMSKVFSLGGTGTGHPDDFAAYRIAVTNNRVSKVQGKLAQLVSCQDCSLEGNEVADVGAGVLLSAAATGSPECEIVATGCGASMGTRIVGNRLRRLHGGGDAASADIFVVADDGEAGGLMASDNVYCAAKAGGHRFGWLGMLIPFSEWVTATGTDASSQALGADNAACAD